MSEIKIAETDDEIRNCFAVIAELRPQFQPEDFLEQVKRQMTETKFRLIYLDDNGIKAVGSYRIGEWLAGGKYLEIEDLAAKSGHRSKG